jgi:hypothetical protein
MLRSLVSKGVSDLKSSRKVASSTVSLEESGGPERAGSRLKKNGTSDFFREYNNKLVESRDQDSTSDGRRVH